MLPVIKWTGSRRSQAGGITALFPKFERYYEPFLGGGSILARASPERATCGDICRPLIDFWIMVRDDPRTAASGYRRRWNRLQKGGHPVYYDIRDRFNRTGDPLDLLFLSRTCANGLIRFNSDGKFNTAFHHTRRGIHPDMLEELIFDWSELVRSYRFIHDTYQRTTSRATPGDLVYLDPPYGGTSGQYYGGISVEELVKYLKSLNQRSVRWILSYDGSSGSRTYGGIPGSVYKRRISLVPGNPPFKKVMDGHVERVTESVYLSF